MVTYCCVPLCRNRIGGHVFPKEPGRRLRWRLAIKRKCGGTIDKLWNPAERSLVCYDHFRPKDYKPNCIRKVLIPDAVPSVFNFRPSSSRNTINSAGPPQTQYSPTLNEEMLDTEVPDIALQFELGGDKISDTEDNQSSSQPSHTDNQQEHEPRRHVQAISGTATQTDSSPFYLNFEAAMRNEDFVIYFTGFRNHEHFLMLFNLLCPAALSLDYRSELGPKIELFVLLTKLRRAKDDVELGFFFDTHQTVISQIVNTWINFLYAQLKEVDIWASGRTIQQFSPMDFHSKFPRTRIPGNFPAIDKPKDVLLQSTSFSHYKNKNTMKCIVGISPRGAVTFISDGYGGSTSDRQIVERSSLLTMFDKGDGILVDRGLTIQDLSATSDVKVDIPTFLKGRYHLDVQEVAHDRKVASKRIHAERIIGLTKKFKILDRSLNHSKRALAGRIMYICFSLINFFPTIVDEYA